MTHCSVVSIFECQILTAGNYEYEYIKMFCLKCRLRLEVAIILVKTKHFQAKKLVILPDK